VLVNSIRQQRGKLEEINQKPRVRKIGCCVGSNAAEERLLSNMANAKVIQLCAMQALERRKKIAAAVERNICGQRLQRDSPAAAGVVFNGRLHHRGVCQQERFHDRSTPRSGSRVVSIVQQTLC
jgi:hypothetical protein